MKFKAIQILTLLSHKYRVENILGQSIGIQFMLGNEWDSEYPEHKLVQYHKTCSIDHSSRKRGGNQK